ncbi:MAG: hypothetical protein EBQ56_01930, partial [Proteobacteria bacterium]|nr:hypothetical protein [Pseudomonadota bacterium]
PSKASTLAVVTMTNIASGLCAHCMIVVTLGDLDECISGPDTSTVRRPDGIGSGLLSWMRTSSGWWCRGKPTLQDERGP